MVGESLCGVHAVRANPLISHSNTPATLICTHLCTRVLLSHADGLLRVCG